MIKLPTYEFAEAKAAGNHKNLTATEAFVFNEEPQIGADAWRKQLADVINEHVLVALRKATARVVESAGDVAVVP